MCMSHFCFGLFLGVMNQGQMLEVAVDYSAGIAPNTIEEGR